MSLLAFHSLTSRRPDPIVSSPDSVGGDVLQAHHLLTATAYQVSLTLKKEKSFSCWEKIKHQANESANGKTATSFSDGVSSSTLSSIESK